MEFLYGKPLDSFRLKRSLDKSRSVTEFRAALSAVRPGSPYLACPLCGGAEREGLKTIFGFDWQCCKTCGVAYVANPPSRADVEALYRSEFYTRSNKTLLANDSVIEFRRNEVARPKVEHVKNRLTTASKKWLDIGCGVGELLSVAKELGFETLGIETNEMEREYARDRFGIDVIGEYLDETTVGKYRGHGIISLMSSLEHMLDPHGIIRNIAALQSPGDNLIIEVPHYPSISAYSQMTFPEHVNRMMCPPLHLFLFSLPSLETLLGKHGYRINSAWLFGQDFYEFFSTLGLFAPGLSGSPLHHQLAPLINGLQQCIDEHRLSDEVLITCERLP